MDAVARGAGGGGRHGLHRHPVELVILVGERRAVALAQGRPVADGVVAIGLVIGGRRRRAGGRARRSSAVAGVAGL